jgi:hypothetical protein
VTVPKSVWLAGVSVVLMVVGAVGPWAKVLGVLTINGTDDSKDGWIVVGAAAFAVVGVLVVLASRLRWLALIPLLAAAIAAATAAYDVSDINGVGGGRIASAQWGIYLALAGSIALVLASVAMIVEVRRPAPPVAEDAATPPGPPA